MGVGLSQKISELRQYTDDVREADSSSLTGLYNINGLQRFREGLAEVGVRRDGTGLGGVDVVFWGDSIPSAYAYSVRSDMTPAILRNLLQDRYNPIMRNDGSVYGGPGFIPCYGGDTGWTTNDPKAGGGARTDLCMSQDGTAPSYTDTDWQFVRWSNSGPITDRRMRFTFAGSGTLAIRNRDRVTDVEPIVRRFSGDDTIRLDVNTSDAFVVISGGAGTIAANGATSQAHHWGRPAGWTGLTATNTNCVQFGSPSAGTFFNDLFGVIGYCDDWDKGIRVHGICNPATRIADWMSGAALDTYAEGLINNFSSSAPGSAAAGATRAKLFISNLLLNDLLLDDGVTYTSETYKAAIIAVVDQIRGRASRPCLLWVIPSMGTNTTRHAKCPAYIRAIKEVAAANSDIMAVFDVNEYLGGGVNGSNASAPYTGVMTSMGIVGSSGSQTVGDGSHMNNLGHTWLGHLLFRVLS